MRRDVYVLLSLLTMPSTLLYNRNFDLRFPMKTPEQRLYRVCSNQLHSYKNIFTAVYTIIDVIVSAFMLVFSSMSYIDWLWEVPVLMTKFDAMRRMLNLYPSLQAVDTTKCAQQQSK